MQTTTTAICDWLEAHPESLPKARRFAEYYIPTTLKLLHTYNDVQGQQGENAETIRRDIAGILHTLNQAYENLYNNLLSDVAMDISSEIAALQGMLANDGLILGICNGFQALIKLGLVPFGRILDTDVNCPTLTFNRIARHQSKLVRIRVSSNTSPWLAGTQIGDIYTVPVSHGEGRFLASDAMLHTLLANGQIATQYVDADGQATMDIQYNPNGSAWAIEGITSPDGRVIGKMGHTERVGKGLYRNVPGETDMKMFESAVRYLQNQ